MNPPLPDRKVIRKDARELLEMGSSKQETYESLSEKYHYKLPVAEEVRWLPAMLKKKKYQIWNYLLVVLMLSWAGLSVWQNQSWYGFLPHLVFAYIAARMLLRYYYWFVFYPFGVLAISLVLIISEPESLKSEWLEAIAGTVLAVAPFLLAFWLTKKLCPKPLERIEEYHNNNGERRQRIVYTFIDR